MFCARSSYSVIVDHSVGHGHHTGDIDWTAMAAQLELEGEVLQPYVSETAARVADLCREDGIEVRLTGGLGAPLVKGLCACEGGFHHFLLVDVPAGNNRTPVPVEVVKFKGTPVKDDEDESKEVE